MAVDNLPPLREIIQRYDLSAKKSLGQNFLLDLNLTMKIARKAGDMENYEIIEVGPGPGGLTRALLASGAKKVIAVERDRRCVEALSDVLHEYPDRLQIVEANALEIDFARLVSGPAKIVANLPYNVATPLLTGWLGGNTWPPFFTSMTLMFQKEVANRICANVGSKAYGRLGVFCGWRTYAEQLFDIPPQAFTPPPKVTSTVVQLQPKQNPLPCMLENLTTVTRAAFGQRRKMLRSSLKQIGGDDLLKRAEINGEKRAEALTIEEFVRLANSL